MAAGSDQRIEVLHVVGGTTHLGGVMAFVNNITTPQPGVSHFIWKHRECRPPANASATWTCEGAARQTDVSMLSDLVGAARDLPRLLSWLRRHPKAILYAHSRMGLAATALTTRLKPGPVLMHMHARARRPALYRRIWRMSRATVLFNSRQTCRHYGHDPQVAHVVTPSIPWPGVPATEPSEKTDAPRFVAASLFVPGKNVHIIVNAFKRLSERSAAVLCLFGSRPELAPPDYGESLARSAGQNPAIRMMGWNAAWTGQLTSRDIFVHAAQEEGFGMAMLEAFARGCRLVVPTDTFLDELPSPLDTLGIERARSSDETALAEAMRRAQATPVPPGGFWQVRTQVSSCFSIETSSVLLGRIYRSLQTDRTGEDRGFQSR